MFNTLNYFWYKYWNTVKRGKPNMKSFLIFLRMLGLDLKCLLLTGYTTDEIKKRK